MLAIAVVAHDQVVVLSCGEAEARLLRRPDPDVMRQLKKDDPQRLDNAGRVVLRTVVDDGNVGVGQRSLDRSDDVRQARLLVEGGNDHQHAGRLALAHVPAPCERRHSDRTAL